MSSTPATNRLTSKDIVVEYLPCGVEATHDEDILFQTDVSGGDYQLRVNGYLTDPITFAPTTLDSDAQTAIDAITELSDLTFTVTALDQDGDATNDGINITVAENEFVVIDAVDISLTGNTSSDPNIQEVVNTQGSTTYRISSEITTFSYGRSVEVVDVTAISEYEATEIPVKSTMSFDATIYDASEDWTRYILEEGQSGLYTVYKAGKLDGKEYFQFTGLLESVDKDFPDHEKIEINISGMRQGKMVTPFGSIYKV